MNRFLLPRLLLLSGFLLCFSLVAAHPLLAPVPPPPAIDPAVYQLGRALFHDPRLSANQQVSCASCHDLSSHGADALPLSVGVDGAQGQIRALTVYNASLNPMQFWDGRVRTLEEQVDGPLHDVLEMASSWPEVLSRLAEDRQLVAAFEAAYAEGMTPQTLRSALADFQRTLVTLNSPFDLWLAGETSAMDAQQQRGYRYFIDYGCVSCHQGANLGGNMVARMGSLHNYMELKGAALNHADLGRYRLTGRDDDRYVFRVPGLRSAALQSYFFHDASASSLEEAIDMMAHYQLGRHLPDEHRRAIAAFLTALVGEHPERQVEQP
ncbi:cytochrome c peroxidase [Marinospirillum sp. MEB164]|uniref:Cytochrome c peroxidase n=1 Tax=Marinospirillum alkalitolerans TaxID=3123374 RepID=A0ABW8Q052_9GAMM